MYQYTDKNGNLVFTDRPPTGSNADEVKLNNDRVFKSAPRRYEPSTSTPSAPVEEERRKRDYSDVNVIMYMTSWWGYCKRADVYVRELGVNLVEYNIETDREKKEEMKKKSGGATAVPLLDIEGQIIHGFSQDAIKAAIEKSRMQRWWDAAGENLTGDYA